MSTCTTDTISTRRFSSIFRRGNASLLSLSSVTTVLPDYSPSVTLDDARSTDSTLQNERHSPPRYSFLTPVPQTYDPNNPRRFQYSFPNKPKNAWATLHLHTRDNIPGHSDRLQTQPRLPRLLNCDPITGSVELALGSKQNIQQIVVSVSGRIVLSANKEWCIKFLGHDYTIWNKAMGNPLEQSAGTGKDTFDGRFAPGIYKFPFSLPFPTDTIPAARLDISPPVPTMTIDPIPFMAFEPVPSASVPEKTSSSIRKDGSSTSPPSYERQASTSAATSQPLELKSLASLLPQSFIEKGMNVDVVYDISVRISRGGLKSIASSRIETKFVHIPALEPHPVPTKRREAYEAGGLLPSPLDDSEGWLALPSVRLPQHMSAHCTLHLARPLTYTRGSVIPCFLAISSDDDRLAYLLSDPKAPVVRLLRRIVHPVGRDEAGVVSAMNGIRTDTGMNCAATVTTFTPKVNHHEVGRAHWWWRKDVESSTNVQYLEGEIHIHSSLQPSCLLDSFQVEYVVELLPFRTDGLTLEFGPSTSGKANQSDQVLASHRVEVTTLHRQDEPVPTVYSEPPKGRITRRVKVDGDDNADSDSEAE